MVNRMMAQHIFLQEEYFVDRKAELKGFDKLLQPETAQAVMLIEAEEKMGKSWLAAKMHQSFVQQYAGMPSVYIDFDNPLDKAKLTDHLAFIRMLRDRIMLPDYFAELNAVINRVTENQPSAVTSRPLAALSERIQSHYTLDELERMARFHNVDWENLTGEGKFTRTYGMVNHLFQRNELDALFERLRQERSNVEWSPYFQAVTALRNAETTESGIGEGSDEGRSLIAMSMPDQKRAEDEIDRAFFDALARILAEQAHLVFLFDTIDRATVEAYRFIEQKLIPHLLDERLKAMVIVITGRSVPTPVDGHVKPLVVPPRKLQPFTEDDIRDYMAVRSIEEQPPDFTWKGMLWMSGGVPGELALMADRLTARSSQTDSFFDD